MAATKSSVKLSAQRQGGKFRCWRKTIGGRSFYLSSDRQQAERMASALITAWAGLKAAGVRNWTDDVIAVALALAGVPEHTHDDHKPTGTQHLHDAIDDYLADYKSGVSPGRYLRQVVALNDFRSFQADVALRLIGGDAIARVVSHYRSRPKTQRGTCMAVATVQTTVKAIFAFFDWCDLTDRWEAPRRFERFFRVKYQALKTPLEIKRDGDGPAVFTIAELRRLWQNATQRQRLYLGLALNTGEIAEGIADLMKLDFQWKGKVLVVDRHRGKTGVHGVYPLWQEVQTLVLDELDDDASEPLAFKTSDGHALVWYQEKGRVDSIAKTWTNLLAKCDDVRALPFSTLRKTGASMIREVSGSLEIAQTYLSHRGDTVAEKHYLSRRFERFDECLSLLRKHLSPVLDSLLIDSASAA